MKSVQALVEELLSEKKMSEFEKLKRNKVKLSDEERAKVAAAKAEWSDGNSAVWKSVCPESGKTTYVTHTHRCYQTADSVEGACNKFHKVVKGTA